MTHNTLTVNGMDFSVPSVCEGRGVLVHSARMPSSHWVHLDDWSRGEKC